MRWFSSSVVSLVLVFAGCGESHLGPTRSAAFPIKIGLLADTQITSQNGFTDFSQRSKRADTMVDVAIRPPALERCLAKEMAEVALERLTQDSGGGRTGADVILYLGDGANSGGADEIETLFGVLEECRRKTQTPIFVVIGNHDYLGCGNIATMGTRFAMLNQMGRPDNAPLTKYEVLKKISDFNHASDRLPTNAYFRYSDNIATVERHKNLDHGTGLYLSGRLMYARPGQASVEIFLVDSSDYQNAPNWSENAKLGFYGAIGSVSFKDDSAGIGLSQLGYCLKAAEGSRPDFRIIASHYPKNHLDRLTFAKPGQVPLNVTDAMWEITEGAFSLTEFTKSLNFYLNKLILPNKRNYWVSGHTHAQHMPAAEKIPVGGFWRAGILTRSMWARRRILFSTARW